MMLVHTKFGKFAGRAGQNRALQMAVLERYALLSVIEKLCREWTKRLAEKFMKIDGSLL
jgi:hypothetical protein